MARQGMILKIKGTLGTITFFQSKDEDMVGGNVKTIERNLGRAFTLWI